MEVEIKSRCCGAVEFGAKGGGGAAARWRWSSGVGEEDVGKVMADLPF